MVENDVIPLSQFIQTEIHSAAIKVVTIYKYNLIVYQFCDDNFQRSILIAASHGFIDVSSIYLIECKDTPQLNINGVWKFQNTEIWIFSIACQFKFRTL